LTSISAKKVFCHRPLGLMLNKICTYVMFFSTWFLVALCLARISAWELTNPLSQYNSQAPFVILEESDPRTWWVANLGQVRLILFAIK
jgi:hypothetical protein